MPRVFIEPFAIEPALLGEHAYRQSLLMLRVEILSIERRFGPKEHLTLLKRLIDNVLIQMMRTQHYFTPPRLDTQDV